LREEVKKVGMSMNRASPNIAGKTKVSRKVKRRPGSKVKEEETQKEQNFFLSAERRGKGNGKKQLPINGMER